jgi:zinc protease
MARSRSRIPLLVAAALAASSARAAAPQQPALERLVHRTALDNGLQVIVVENPTVPLATVLVAVRNGAFTQDSAEQGLAHLYEHVLFRSYRGDATAFGMEASRLNGRFNGATSDEVVYYFVAVPSKRTDDAIQLMARLLQDARFSEGDLKDERPVVLNELQRYQSDPELRLERRVERMLWGVSWSRKDKGGDSSSLAGISLDRLKQTYARYYVPNNAALIVTGDVSSAHVFDEARRRFRGWKPGADPFADRPIPAVSRRSGSAAVMVGDDVLDVTIRIALQGPSVDADTAATYAADVLFDILNDPASAFQRRLVDQGPFQSVSGHYLTLDHAGPIEFVGKTTPERAEEALTDLVGELGDLDLLDGIMDDDLAIARKHRQVGMALSLEQTAMLAPQLALWWASAGLDYYLRYNERMAAQTMDDLRRFAQAYVVSNPRVIGVLAPPPTTQRLAAWLDRARRTRSP